jgi:glycine reductase
LSLVLESVAIDEFRLGARDAFAAGCLEVDADGLAQHLRGGIEVIDAVRVHRALPGESTRIHCCKDVLQPSHKVAGDHAGRGRRRLLTNMAIVTCGPIVGFQEGIIDMSGPGADYTPFSKMPLLALEIDVARGTPPHVHEAALREAGLTASERVSRICHGATADCSRTLSWNEHPVDPELPRIGYICMVLSQGLLHDTWVMGRNAREGLPLVLDPRVTCDAGIVSGNCVSACDKNTSWHHRNNPVVEELLAGHGTRWNFVGMVVTNQPIRLADKQRSAADAVALARGLDPQGVVVTKEGFGNPDSDFMMILAELRRAGVVCVGVTDEFAGRDGASQSLADAVAEADAIVSTGNANQQVLLPPMARCIGHPPDVARLAGGYAGSVHDDGSLEVELQAIMGATNELGAGTLSAREI